MRALFRKVRDRRFKYNPLIEVRVYKDNLLHNLRVFENLDRNVKVTPVLKSNAYGHGLVPVAKIFDTQDNVPFLIVDSYYEAMVLRNESVTKPILVIGYTQPENIVRSNLKDVSFTITTSRQLEELSQKLNKPQKFHIKVDTGMHRQGLLPEELDEAIEIVRSGKNIEIEGFCSHFADADGEDSSFTREQAKLWKRQKTAWQRAIPETKYYHLANTAGTRSGDNYGANVSRVGIGLYGIDPYPSSKLDLKPVLEMKTILTGVKKLKKGEKVGYNVTFTAPSDMTIATVPAGYYEGVDRRLSNKGSMLVSGVECSIVGRVSMNITTIDVSEVVGVGEGDEVIVISSNADHENSVENIASQCQTIPYVVLVHVASELRRVVV